MALTWMYPFSILNQDIPSPRRAQTPTNSLHQATVQVHDTKITHMGYRTIATAVCKPEGFAALLQHQFG